MGGCMPWAEAVRLVGALRRHPEKQDPGLSAKTPFASCGRTPGEGRRCDLALNVQVRVRNGMGMASYLPD
ncbi:hypothetical protein GCM10010269_32000 [Streptomyces humidus]|uniref:Uncharacterized protein n=1 Tax=Streptomyces humidus TaxID=52259 RepID=A0A918FW60_9ACTN|nr:hypothetical protein GCM10010269_32000 [Streptomyces humidus]